MFARFLLGSVVLAMASFSTGCSTMSNTGKGALAGGAIGAGTGALIGSATGKAGPGAAIGGLIGAVGVDVARRLMQSDGGAFQLVFASEAALFLLAAILAVRAAPRRHTLEATWAGT